MVKKVEAYEAIHYSVDCKKNDPVDIKCGGPYYLGFDFYVDIERPEEEVREKIRELLEKYNKPCVSIHARHHRAVKKLWTDDMMEEYIRDTTL